MATSVANAKPALVPSPLKLDVAHSPQPRVRLRRKPTMEQPMHQPPLMDDTRQLHDHGKAEHKHASYGLLLAGFSIGVGALMLGARRRGRRPGRPMRGIAWHDLLLMGIATHKIARILANDRVTQPVRAPFVEQDGRRQIPTGSALRHSLGELLTCPYCMAPWVTLGLATLQVHRPDVARTITSLFTSVSVSDFLNRSYARLTD